MFLKLRTWPAAFSLLQPKKGFRFSRLCKLFLMTANSSRQRVGLMMALTAAQKF